MEQNKSKFSFIMLAIGLGALSGFAPIEGLDRTTAAIPKFKNWGLVNNEAKSHIDALKAWEIEEGSRDVVVAVIDTGIDYNHKSLKNNIWVKPDADKKHPIYGWNYVINKPNPVDEHGHGTHVAGIIGAAEDKLAGVSGVAPKVSIMAVKYYSETNSGDVNLENTIKAIEYAVENGARIINYSGGGPQYSQKEYLAIKKAEEKGILFVAAAGNEKQDTDVRENYYYPSAYQLSNVISVAATDINNDLLKSSNWGKGKVDVAAPGENIFSTLPGGRYGHMSGTSQATAFVTGVAALLLSHNPKLTPQQIKKIIRSTVDPVDKLKDKIGSGGKINAYSALLALKNGKIDESTEDSSILAGRPMPLLDTLRLPNTAQAAAAKAGLN